MGKTIKKMLGIALIMMLTLAMLPVSSFAEQGVMQPEDYKVISKLKGSKSWLGGQITGTVDVSPTVSVKPLQLMKDSDTIYRGEINGVVESADLFKGAYDLYKNTYEKMTTPFGDIKNLVMFDENGKYPVATYTVTFSDNITVDVNNVIATENTETISKIEKEVSEHSVKFTFYLGNWNDYKGFFDLVASEQNKKGHEINISVPYTVDSSKVSEGVVGQIKGSGKCLLIKSGGRFSGRKIVNITSPENTININLAR
ncbi:hypothetical protein [Peptostreptococcus anaerobius]|uniref:hypothetical protein n=1 Tax=Peptostreptococcus anaerobius TaxID=1261 RepID=UPI0032197C82